MFVHDPRCLGSLSTIRCSPDIVMFVHDPRCLGSLSTIRCSPDIVMFVHDPRCLGSLSTIRCSPDIVMPCWILFLQVLYFLTLLFQVPASSLSLSSVSLTLFPGFSIMFHPMLFAFLLVVWQYPACCLL